MNLPNNFESKDDLPLIASVDQWKDEIRSILAGKRDGYLNKSGSVDRYISKLKTISNVDCTEDHFNDALESIVWSWQTHEIKETEYFAIMLQLIGLYTPVGGYRKVYRFLRYWESRMGRLENKSGYDSKSNLILSAIGTLFAYFDSPPEVKASKMEKALYHNFLSFLDKYLTNSSFAHNVIVLLLNYKIIDIHNFKIRTSVNTTLKSVYSLVSYVLSAKRKLEQNDNLAALAEHIYWVGGEAIDLFQERLKLYNYSILFSGPNLIVQTQNELIPISLSDRADRNLRLRATGLHRLPEYFEEAYNRRNERDRNRIIQDVLTLCERNDGEFAMEFGRALYSLEHEYVNIGGKNASLIIVGFKGIEIALVSQYLFQLQNLGKEPFLNLAESVENEQFDFSRDI